MTRKAALALALALCSTPLAPAKNSGSVKVGVASYYADKFHGRKTANGERFDQTELTAAHKTLPFGTKVKVTNLKTGRSVVVRINDRGPFVKGRNIDLSRRAAKKIKMVKSGIAPVALEVVHRPGV